MTSDGALNIDDVRGRAKVKDNKKNYQHYRAWRLVAKHYAILDRLVYGVSHDLNMVVPLESTFMDDLCKLRRIPFRTFVARRARELRQLGRHPTEASS